MYTIKTNKWSPFPALNAARIYHSSFVAGKLLCVLGGIELNNCNSNTIETYDLRILDQGRKTKWQSIKLKDVASIPQFPLSFIAQLSTAEIFIFGGKTD